MSTIAVNSITPSTGSTVTIPAFVPAGQFSLRNKIINGKMDIAQRGTSFAGLNAAAGTTYTLDRFAFITTAADVQTITQQADVPSSNEFQNSLRAAVTTADTSIAAGDTALLIHRVEGYNARDLIGKTFTLSFWARSSKTGTHCVSFVNGGGDRSYVAEYTINAANTWEQKTITVSGGLITAGTWNWTNGIGINIFWALAAGSTYQTTANAWQTGNFRATANQVNCLDTIGNIFAITGVQLEVGAVATPFEHRPYGTELALCQRYAQILQHGGTGRAETTTKMCISCQAFTPMRASPSGTSLGTLVLRDLTTGTTRTAVTPGAININLAAEGGVYIEFTPASWTPSNFTIGNLAVLSCSAGLNGILITAEL